MTDHWKDQPRVPAGSSEGGRWASSGVRTATVAAREAAGLPPEDTETMYRNKETGEWDAEREKQHDEWFAEMHALMKERHGSAPVENPESWMMGGGSGAGKGRLADDPSTEHGIPTNRIVADSDEFKKIMDEYNQKIADGKINEAAPFVHEESSYLAKKFMKEAVNDNYNTVLDGTGDGSIDKVRQKIRDLSPDGRPVHGVYVTCSVDEAIRRAEERKARTGRNVPESYMRLIHAKVSEVFPAIVSEGLFKTVRLYDTDVKPPKLIAYGEGSDLSILDQELYAKFLAKASAK